jgi:tripartite-type tricarboxylate transporter receptor subunit TctC
MLSLSGLHGGQNIVLPVESVAAALASSAYVLPEEVMNRNTAVSRTAAGLALAIAATLSLGAHPRAQQSDPAANYPNGPIKVIVTVSAGGGVDTATRIVASKLQQRFGQPVVVENRVGAGGNIAGEAVFTSNPDGYTLLASPPNTITISALLHLSINFDPAAFEPVAVMSKFPNVLLVRPDFPVTTAQQFLAYAKTNPGKLNYASQGIGSTSHLTAELFMTATGSKLIHIPYKGTAPALNDIIASHVDLMFTEVSTALKLHESGKARILAVATDKRLDILPDIPTLEEVGVPNFDSDTWNAISAPPKTPPAVMARLNAAINDVLNDQDVRARFKALDLKPVGGSLDDTRKFVSEETRRWSEVIRKAGLKPQ